MVQTAAEAVVVMETLKIIIVADIETVRLTAQGLIKKDPAITAIQQTEVVPLPEEVLPAVIQGATIDLLHLQDHILQAPEEVHLVTGGVLQE